MSILSTVVGVLRRAGVAHALVGAGAMAAHGVSRSTTDVDLLVTSRLVLDAPFWRELAGEARVDVRRGDLDDPLAGVVRITRTGERVLDLIVGRHAWQQVALERARTIRIGDLDLPVVTVPDLILLKLYAGGPQDAWDIKQLLGLAERPAIETEVAAGLPDLPEDAARLWEKARSR